MRPIDAEKLEKFIEDRLNSPDEKKRFGHDAIEIITEIHFSETIKVEPLRHGKWIKKSERAWFDNLYEVYYLCSCCNDIVYIMYNYCPNCGAKMEGGK